MIQDIIIPALIGLPIWWTGWQILDHLKQRFTRQVRLSQRSSDS
jgi:hypothetical protein